MTVLLALLVVPAGALALVLGMDRLEDNLLKAPARHRGEPARRGDTVRPVPSEPALATTQAAA